MAISTKKNTNQETLTPEALARQKRRLFYIINVLIIFLISGSMITNKSVGLNDAFYTILLALICTLPILFTTSYRGKQSLMLMFLAFYFGTFGLKDISGFLANTPVAFYEVDKLFSTGEISILLGAICFIFGYSVILIFRPNYKKGILTRDWSYRSTSILGVSFWLIGIYIEATLRFGLLDFQSDVQATHATGVLILFRYLQPLGSLILIYLYLTTRNKSILVILLMTIFADSIVGFLGDSKVTAIRAPILYLFSYVLLRDRAPITQIVIFVLVGSMLFNVFDSYRATLHSSKDTKGESYEKIDEKIKEIADQNKSTSERLAEGFDYFANRVTLKNNLELLMFHVPKDVGFLDGKTIDPIIYAFIPRFIMPDKPESNLIGQHFNRTFELSGSPDTFISLSQVGELYWNYDWVGLIIGMTLIGAFMGLLASTLRLDTIQTLPRFLLLLMTIYFLIVGFETAVAQSYTLWARFFVLLLLINHFIPKEKPVSDQEKNDSDEMPPLTKSNKRIIAYKKQ